MGIRAIDTDAFYYETSNPHNSFHNDWLDSFRSKDEELKNYYFMDWKVTNELVDKVVFKNIKKEELDKSMDKYKRIREFKKGMPVTTEIGRGYVASIDYQNCRLGVLMDGRKEGFIWCDVDRVDRDYSRIGKIIVETLPAIKNVVFNDPLTVIVWEDGTKTYVKASGEDTFDPEKGMALAIAKKAMENKYNYFETIREWIEKDQKRKAKRAKKKEPEVIGKVVEKKVTEEGVTAKVVIDGNLEVLKALGIVEPVDKEEEYFE